MSGQKLSTKQLEELLINKQFYNIIVEESVESTNDIVKEEGKKGIEEGLVVIANKQTSGKGRLGRSFYSPSDTGIYMSILLKPDLDADKTTILTTAAALAICKSIREVLCYDASIKWVNDIILENKKVSGILTEGRINPENNKMDYVVVGIGINVEEPEGGFPSEISDIATSLVNNTTRINKDDNLKNKLVAKILDNIYFYYNDMDLNEEFIRYEYISFSNTLGKDIDIINGDEIEEARVIGIAENIGLIVKNDNGIKTLYSGEISIRER